MTRFPRRLMLSLAAGAAGLVGLAAGPVQAATARAPHVVAHPDNVMVGTTTHLTGTGFTPKTSVVVEECSATSWVVPENPCADNAVTALVSSTGTFHHRLVATVCPSAAQGPAGFVERCYVGVPEPSGVDTITLVGASPLTVTGP